MSIRVKSGKHSVQVDLRVVPAESFGAAMQYFTGSKEHNIVTRGMARERGLKINEYGVYKVEGEKETYVAGASERTFTPRSTCPSFRPSCARTAANSSGPKRVSCPS